MRADEKRTLAHGDSWREWGKQFGWRLYGWTEDYAASFFHSDGQLIEITKAVRADIDTAMLAARGEGE